jgi:hypothetical protein
VLEEEDKVIEMRRKNKKAREKEKIIEKKINKGKKERRVV